MTSIQFRAAALITATLPPKAAQHAGTEVGGSHLPPKAAQHAGTEVGGSHLPPKAVQHAAA